MKKIKAFLGLAFVCLSFSFVGKAVNQNLSDAKLWAGFGYMYSKYTNPSPEHGLVISVVGTLESAAMGAIVGGPVGVGVGIAVGL